MDKIGVINFHRATNYGAVLQAYALNETINKLGGNAVTLDYKNPFIEKIYDPRHINDKRLKSLLVGIITYKRRKRKRESFEYFRSKYLNMDQTFDPYSIANAEHLKEYKTFITGSDQVWNCALTEFDKTYFLDFVSNHEKKNSYAASFGFDQIPNEYIEDYQILLEGFNHITVREQQGAEIIKNLLKRPAEVVLDPTMLLLKDDWSKISQDYKAKKDYILIYQLATSDSLLQFAANLSKQSNCEIIFISDALRRRIKANYVTGISPCEFLGLVNNARYIITNSFHGIAFSIIFHKNFFVELQPSFEKTNSRLENILDIFNLRYRLIVDGKNDNVFTPIDYTPISQKLELERQHSLDYLQRILEE